MKEYSVFTKTVSTIISIILSYFLVIISFRGTSLLPNNVTDNVRLWGIISFGGALLCIIAPIIFAWYKFKFKLLYLLWVFPVVFLLVLIYSPLGFYFIIPKGGLFYPEPKSDDWKYGFAISIMFYTLQLFALIIVKGIMAFREEGKREKNLKLQHDNSNQGE